MLNICDRAGGDFLVAFGQRLRSSETETSSLHCVSSASTGKPLMVPLVLATHGSCIPLDTPKWDCQELGETSPSCRL